MADNAFFQIDSKQTDSFDYITFFLTITLIAFGLISIYSATYTYSNAYDTGMSGTFYRQLLSGGIGLAGMITIFLIPERWIERNSIFLYAIGVAMLVLVLIIGKSTYGTRGWLSIAGFSIQPAEVAKITTLLAVAQYMGRKGTDIRTIRDFGVVAGIVLLPVALIMLQPDTGSATVLLAMTFGILLWTGYNIFIIYSIVAMPFIVIASLFNQIYGIIAIVIFSTIAIFFRQKILLTVGAIIVFIALGSGAPLIYQSLQPHQQDRIATFLDPNNDPRGKGYNVIQSKMAVGSGGLTGKGFMHGTQTQLRYIPKQWTDFIYSVPTEEFGFVGGVAVIALIMGLIFRAVKTAQMTDNPFSSIVAIGIASIFLYHTIINIGMAIGLMPVMGIPLPFMSAGGTSLMTNMAMIGLLLNIYRTKKIKR